MGMWGDRAFKGPNGNGRFCEPFIVRSQVVRGEVDLFSEFTCRQTGLPGGSQGSHPDASGGALANNCFF
ncbi:hypothetical protein D3A96_15135 [Robertkochia marina]|nr:hypothetical protein D3A96_15135 [Robertkochia marina]